MFSPSFPFLQNLEVSLPTLALDKVPVAPSLLSDLSVVQLLKYVSKGFSFSRGLQSSLQVTLQDSQVLKCQWRILSPPRNGPFKTRYSDSQEAVWKC